MRIKITLTRTSKQRMLPMDYQYYIGAWIYKVIGNANHEFASFLHSEGYRDGNKQFKLFNYSPLDFGKPKLWKERSLFEILTLKTN
jgi:CRISPR-associated endoribonuclease Cas6